MSSFLAFNEQSDYDHIFFMFSFFSCFLLASKWPYTSRNALYILPYSLNNEYDIQNRLIQFSESRDLISDNWTLDLRLIIRPFSIASIMRWAASCHVFKPHRPNLNISSCQPTPFIQRIVIKQYFKYYESLFNFTRNIW